ncbi:hypothetical protein ACGFNY_45715, partial [Streptomyces chartreusis]|uniref:hypothetical protein n=1 Tax=Streptomyces chartreusis TaxID=1969 RepID=UPI00371C1FF5
VGDAPAVTVVLPAPHPFISSAPDPVDEQEQELVLEDLTCRMRSGGNCWEVSDWPGPPGRHPQYSSSGSCPELPFVVVLVWKG